MRKVFLIVIITSVVYSILCSQEKQNIVDYYYESLAQPKTVISNLDYNLTIQRINADTTVSWPDKSSRYHNYFIHAVNSFRNTEDLKEIWYAGFVNDPYETCINFRSTLDTDNEYFNFPQTANLIFSHLLREYEHYDSVCVNYLINYSLDIKKKLSKIDDLDQPDNNSYKREHKISEAYLTTVDTIFDNLDKYPGRSIVGIEHEDKAWLVIYNSSLEKMIEYQPFVDKAIVNRDLHPKYEAYLADRINMLKGKPQTYGTQYTANGKVQKLHPLKYSLNKTNEFRTQKGIKIILKRE